MLTLCSVGDCAASQASTKLGWLGALIFSHQNASLITSAYDLPSHRRRHTAKETAQNLSDLKTIPHKNRGANFWWFLCWWLFSLASHAMFSIYCIFTFWGLEILEAKFVIWCRLKFVTNEHVPSACATCHYWACGGQQSQNCGIVMMINCLAELMRWVHSKSVQQHDSGVPSSSSVVALVRNLRVNNLHLFGHGSYLHQKSHKMVLKIVWNSKSSRIGNFLCKLSGWENTHCAATSEPQMNASKRHRHPWGIVKSCEIDIAHS